MVKGLKFVTFGRISAVIFLSNSVAGHCISFYLKKLYLKRTLYLRCITADKMTFCQMKTYEYCLVRNCKGAIKDSLALYTFCQYVRSRIKGKDNHPRRFRTFSKHSRQNTDSANTRHLYNPAGICCQNDVVSTSMRRNHVASTLIRRHFRTKCPLGTSTLRVPL